jgi:MFS family permease
VARRFGSLWGVVGLRLLIVPVFALLIVVPNVWLAVLGWVVRQTTISMSWPIDSTFIAEVLPPRARSHVFGLRSAAWNVGFSAASLLAGWLIVRTGYGITFFSLILFTVISMALFAGYYGRHPRVLAGEIPTALHRAARLRLEQAARAREEVAVEAVTPVATAGSDSRAGPVYPDDRSQPATPGE